MQENCCIQLRMLGQGQDLELQHHRPWVNEQDIRSEALWKKVIKMSLLFTQPQQVLLAVKHTIFQALQILWKSQMLSDLVGSYMACCPSYWFWSLAMAHTTNQLCSSHRFYHWTFYSQFLKDCECKPAPVHSIGKSWSLQSPSKANANVLVSTYSRADSQIEFSRVEPLTKELLSALWT